MVKSVKEAVQDVVKGSTQNVLIHLRDKFDDIEAVFKPETVIYEDIAGYSLNGDWVAVMDKNGTTFVHPARDVQFVKHYNKE